VRAVTLCMEHFPADVAPYPQQVRMTETMLAAHAMGENGLICAPTGCGKSLAVVASAIAMSQAKKADGTTRPTYVLTRTHTQVPQLVAALKRARGFTGTMTVLGSRERSCQRFPGMKGAELKDACAHAVSKKECSFHESRGLLTYAGVEDIEDMCARGRELSACVYYANKERALTADIVFAPYSYLLDPSVRDALELREDGNILIDEGHNVENVLREANSFVYARSLIRRAETAMTQRKRHALALLLKQVADTRDVTAHSGVHCAWDLGNLAKLDAELAELVKQERGSKLEVAQKLVRVLVTMKENPKDYVIYVEPDVAAGTKGDAGALAVNCLNPAVGMRALKAHCICLLSGTLEPFDAVESELGVKFPHRVSLPHVIDMRRSALVRQLSGWEGVKLDSTYKNASSLPYQQALGRALLAVAETVPNGVLVFFTSYAQLDACVSAWGPLYAQIDARKSVFVEARQGELPLAAYREAAASARGAVFLGVYGGKLSEGVDFVAKDARCVVCIGVPNPSLKSQAIVQKKGWNDLNRRTHYDGWSWYRMVAIRAVCQAMGRCLRDRNDYGAILLADESFAQRTKGLSAWALDVCRPSPGGLALKNELQVFFEAKGRDGVV